MPGSRGVGTGGLDYPLQHGKAQRCRSPQEHWFGTFGKAQSYRGRVIIQPLGCQNFGPGLPRRNSELSAQVISMIMVKMRQTRHWK